MASAPISPSLPHTGAGSSLQTQLQKLARRRNAQRLTRSLVQSASWGVGISALAVLAYKTHLIPDGPIWAPAAIIGASLLVGARNGMLQKRGEFTAAREADEALQLDDQLSSALAFVAPNTLARTEKRAPKNAIERARFALWPAATVSSRQVRPLHTDLVPALVNDAQNRAQKLDASRVYPSKFDRRAGILTGLSLAFVAALFAPDVPLFLSVEAKKERVALMGEGEKLVKVAKEIRRETPPKVAVEKELNQKLEKLGQKMARGRLSKRAALGEMGMLKKELQKAQSKSQQTGESGDMPQIAEALRDAPMKSEIGQKVQKEVSQNQLEEAAKKLEEMADKLENGQLSEKEKQEAANDLDKVAQQLKQRGGAANEQAAKQLEEAAKALREQQPQQNGQQNQSPQGQQNQQPQQNGQQQQGGEKGQQQPQGQQNQQQQGNKSGQQQQSNGQQQQQQGGKQSQQGANQQGQQNQQGNQQGQQSPGGNQSPSGQQGQSQNGASGAMRDMANNLRQGSGQGNSQNLQDMLNKLREAENGSNGGGQSGLGQMKNMKINPNGGGEGDGPPGLTPGKDLRPSSGKGNNGGGPGLGPRDQSTGNKGGGQSNVKVNRTGDKRRYGDVWSDRLPGTKSKIDRIKGKWGSEGEVEQLPTRGEAKGGEARTPYYEVYESYKKDAEDAVSREAVPPAYKQPVKDYFESLKP